MKKSKLCLIGLLLTCLGNLNVNGATSFSIGSLTYTTLDDNPICVSVMAKDYSTLSGVIDIPETVTNSGKTYSITKIIEMAFASSKITEISIPSSVTTVAASAFANCEQLRSVTFLPSRSATTIGANSFERCSALKSVILPSKLVALNTNCFKFCVVLESLTIPATVTSISNTTFDNCNNLKEIITLPESAPSLTAAFTNLTRSNITLYVPSEAAKESYAANTYWTGWKEVKIHSINVSDQVDNTDILSEHNGNMISVDLIRTLHPESYNSICLPFDLSEEQVESLFGTECKLQELTYASVSDESLELNFTASDHLEAGKPYLIQPSISVTNPFVVNAVISNNLINCDLGDVLFVGTFSPVDLPNSENILFLKDANTLYLSQGGQLPGLRAYFRLQSSAAKTAAAKRVIMRTDDAVTTISNPESPAASIITKQLIDGQLLILRDGQCFSLQGQRLK